MKVKIPMKLSKNQQKAMAKEIDRQIIENSEVFMNNVDAMLLWTLHVEFGFGKKRLEQAFRAFNREYEKMCEFFQMQDAYPAKYKLKEIGVDMEELRNEKKS